MPLLSAPIRVIAPQPQPQQTACDDYDQRGRHALQRRNLAELPDRENQQRYQANGHRTKVSIADIFRNSENVVWRSGCQKDISPIGSES